MIPHPPYSFAYQLTPPLLLRGFMCGSPVSRGADGGVASEWFFADGGGLRQEEGEEPHPGGNYGEGGGAVPSAPRSTMGPMLHSGQRSTQIPIFIANVRERGHNLWIAGGSTVVGRERTWHKPS